MDRTSAISRAERLLREGKLEGAIAEYVRLTGDHPNDWPAINTLGDLYLQAGDLDRAVTQFVRVADHFLVEGFLPKAAALYRKALKVRGTHEHALVRLSEIAVRQGLVGDARAHLRQLAALRREQGDEPGAAAYLLRLARLDDTETETKLAAARAAQARLDADAPGASDRDPPRSAPAPGLDEPDGLLALGRRELAGERYGEAFAAFTRCITLAPDREGDLLAVADELAQAGNLDAAFECAEIAADAALFAADWHRAIALLERFLEGRSHIPALVKLVEIAGDAGIAALRHDAQARLAEAYRAAGRDAEAQRIVADLRAAGAADADRRPPLGPQVVPADEAAAPEGDVHLASLDLFVSESAAPHAFERTGARGDADDSRPFDPEALDSLIDWAGDDFEALASSPEMLEVDLSGAIGAESRPAPGAGSGSPPDAAGDTHRIARSAAQAELDRGVRALEQGRTEEGSTLLYDLARRLEEAGEVARALAVLVELEARAGAYRDVRDRIARLGCVPSHGDSAA